MGKKSLGRIAVNFDLYLFILPALVYFIVFHYVPMYGVQIAFKDYLVSKGFWGSPWVGLKHFMRFFGSYSFGLTITNTLVLSLYQLIAGFPIPILIALMLNQMMHKRYKQFIQTIIYAPYFISAVVLIGMINVFFSSYGGLFNHLVFYLGGERVNYLGIPGAFRHMYVWTGIWQNSGYSTIIYLATLSGISPDLHEAAIVDGASKLQRVLHIDLPGILPTITTMLILNMGRLMQVGFEKAFLMQNDMNLDASEIIATYVYKVGLLNSQYSFSTAVGLFNNIINLALLLSVNKLVKSFGQSSLW